MVSWRDVVLVESVNRVVLCSVAGGERSVPGASAGLLGAAWLVLAAAEVLGGGPARSLDTVKTHTELLVFHILVCDHVSSNHNSNAHLKVPPGPSNTKRLSKCLKDIRCA